MSKSNRKFRAETGKIKDGIVQISIETTKNILSNDQIQKIEDYLNTRKSMFDTRRMPPSDRPRGME